MSDEVAVQAAPDAPVAPAADEPQPTAPQQTVPEVLSFGRAAKKEARAGLRERATQAVAEATPSVASPTVTNGVVVDANGRGHAADGKYVPGTDSPASDPGPGAEQRAVTESPPADPEAQAAPSEPQPVSINIADPDIRRLVQNRDSVAVPAELEQLVRWAINNKTRSADVQASSQRAMEAQAQIAAKDAQIGALQEQFFAVLQRPDLAVQAADIEQAYGPDAKRQFLAGLFATVQQEISGKVSEAQHQAEQQYAAQQAQQQGIAFYEWLAPQAQSAFQAMGYPVDAQFGSYLQLAMDDAAREWDADAARGVPVEPNTETIYRHLNTRLWTNPQYREGFSAKQAEQAEAQRRQIETETRAALQKQEAEKLQAAARQQRSLNPLAQVPSAVQTGATATRPGEPDLTGLQGPALKRALKAQLHADISLHRRRLTD